MCGFGAHAAYTSTETDNEAYLCDNAFIALMDTVADDDPLLWAKVEASPEWQEFATTEETDTRRQEQCGSICASRTPPAMWLTASADVTHTPNGWRVISPWATY